MSVELIQRGKDKLELKLTDINVSIADILHHELLESDMAASSGVVIPHPLQKVVVLKLLAEPDAKKILTKALWQALSTIGKLEEELNRSLSVVEQ
jgi:DNA-directed RNA polymerase subunit L